MVTTARRPRWFLAGRLGLSLLIFVATVELVATFALPDGYYVWPPGYQRTFDPDPRIVPGISGRALLTINSQGIRGDEFEASQRYRLLAVGASTTICTFLDDTEAWPRIVQDLVNRDRGEGALWMGNVGRPGHTTVQNLLHVEKLLAQHEELDGVILLLGAADLLLRLAISQGFSIRIPSPTEALRTAFSIHPGGNDEASWLSRTGTARLWSMQSWRNPEWKNAQVRDDAENVAAWRRYRQQASKLLPELPELGAALDQYADNVSAIVDIARSRDARVILMTQPVLWRPDLPAEVSALLWMGGPPLDRLAPGRPYYAVPALARGMQLYNERLLELCRERDVECLDLATAIPSERELFYDDAHYSEEGARRVAETVAEHLLGSLPALGPAASR